jgi:hypothetical protein
MDFLEVKLHVHNTKNSILYSYLSLSLSLYIYIYIKEKTSWSESTSELYRPRDRRLSVK